MAYRIDFRRPLEGEIRRILDEEIRGTAEALRSSSLARPDAIHEARKHLKKGRAVLRLIRPSLGAAFAWENDVCRGAARLLAGTRDADAMVETAGRLCAASSAPGRWQPLLDRLGERAGTACSDDEGVLDAVEQRVRGVQVRLSAWKELPREPADLISGTARVFASGRRRYRIAQRRRDPESVHAWRKRTKDLWYHARLMRDLGPVVAAWEATLDRLADTLGQRHDLDVLGALLRTEPLLDGAEGEILTAEIEEARLRLDAEAAVLGDVIYEGGSPNLTRLVRPSQQASPDVPQGIDARNGS